ncbi:MAG: tetratricopeptide repeat protein [Burkholderiales bacterium]|nr:tetratricopeptide repeat protein [Burkholderiales bacterium]
MNAAAAPALTPQAIDDLVDQSIAALERGLLDQAKSGFQTVLQHDPQQFDSLHLLGVIAMRQGDLSQAIALISQAVGIYQDVPEAYTNLGIACMESKQPEQAIAHFDQALTLEPSNAELHFAKGNALMALQRPADALTCFNQTLALQPAHIAALVNRGHTLAMLQRHDQAFADYERAIALQPKRVTAWVGKADALMTLKRYDEALTQYDWALSLQSDQFQVWTHRGNALLKLKRPLDAITSHEQALKLSPQHPAVLTNLAGALREAERWDEALARIDQALSLAPQLAEAHMNRASILMDMGRLPLAREAFAQVIALQPEHADAQWGQGWCDMLMGDWIRGLPQLEWRWKKDSFTSKPRDFTQPLWTGDVDLKGRTILLHAEQGLGDTIQFCRYALLLIEQGAHVLLEVQPTLKSLMATLHPDVQVLGRNEGPLPAFDYHCPLMSLPLAFKTMPDSVPAPDAYLRADPQRVQTWSQRLGPRTQPRIGLVWSGNAAHSNDHNRSIALATMLAALPKGPQYFCLQRDIRGSDLATLNVHPEVTMLTDALQTMDDTAALIELMDQVISVDTSIAHLAGALGKPTSILLSKMPDWRWLLGRVDTPWYGTTRLYRQNTWGSWAEPLREVVQTLAR